MKPGKIIVLGMHPYPWHHQEISDTMRLMTEAFKGCDRVFINPSVGFRRAKLAKMPLNIDWKVHQDGEVLICTPPLETLPSTMGIGRWKKSWSMNRLAKLLNLKLGMDWREKSLFYFSSGGIQESYWAFRTIKPKWSVFDVLDDNLGFPGIPAARKKVLEQQFEYLAGRATRVTAVSKVLQAQIHDKWRKDVQLLPNGVDLKRFQEHASYKEPLPELTALERPFYGFVGALTSWIDFDLLFKTADSLTEGTLVLVGPIQDDAVPLDVQSRLHGHPRICLVGPVIYLRVPHFLHQFDVLLLPRNYLPHSLASDPLKLYEYMAAGKPVVSTALPSARNFSQVVYVGETHDEFLAAVKNSLETWTEGKRTMQIEIASQRSWDDRASKMLASLSQNQMISQTDFDKPFS